MKQIPLINKIDEQSVWAIGDIHGRFDLLKPLVEYALENRRVNTALVFLGDYCDRGPQTKQVFDFVMEVQEKNPSVYALEGNHECFMIDTDLDLKRVPRIWYDNGAGPTLRSYLEDRSNVESTFDLISYERHREWIRNLPTAVYNDTHFFVHAGIVPGLPLEKQTSTNSLLWIRREFLDSDETHFKHIVHGHSIESDRPIPYHNRTNLDSGAFYSNVLSLGMFNEDKEPSFMINDNGVIKDYYPALNQSSGRN